MSVSKRLRYEVLRRDNHACRYCGGSAPDVKLTVDHVVPVALGGDDEPSNLVAACADCNAGKTSSTPDAPLVEDVENDALRWSQAMAQAAEHQRLEAEQLAAYKRWIWNSWEMEHAGWPQISHEPERGWRYNSNPDRTYDWVVYQDAAYELTDDSPIHLADSEEEAEEWISKRHDRLVPRMPRDWDASAHIWMAAGIDYEDIDDAVRTAVAASHVQRQSRYRYFCGIVWRKIEDRQKIARSLLEHERDD